jgi:hypothetical protein
VPELLDPLGPALGEPARGDQGPEQPSLPLSVTASLVGGYRWIEQRLFELLGHRSAGAVQPEIRVHLDGQSARHAWHASLWADRLPVRDGVSADDLTIGPPVAVEVLAALDRTGAEAVPLLAGLYRVVLPRLVTGYACHLRATAAVADGPVIRTLRLVMSDEVEDWHAGERLVQGLLTGPDEVASASVACRALESIVVDAGVGGGLTEWPA